MPLPPKSINASNYTKKNFFSKQAGKKFFTKNISALNSSDKGEEYFFFGDFNFRGGKILWDIL